MYKKPTNAYKNAQKSSLNFKPSKHNVFSTGKCQVAVLGYFTGIVVKCKATAFFCTVDWKVLEESGVYRKYNENYQKIKSRITTLQPSPQNCNSSQQLARWTIKTNYRQVFHKLITTKGNEKNFKVVQNLFSSTLNECVTSHLHLIRLTTSM